MTLLTEFVYDLAMHTLPNEDDNITLDRPIRLTYKGKKYLVESLINVEGVDFEVNLLDPKTNWCDHYEYLADQEDDELAVIVLNVFLVGLGKEMEQWDRELDTMMLEETTMTFIGLN